jgi:hypothetical protein
MKGVEVLQTALKATHNVTTALLSDLSDSDLLARPVPGSNHIAWQLGHFINSEVQILQAVLPQASVPELPAGFAKQHSKETAAQDPPTGFLGKAAYLDLFNKVRQATIAAVGGLSDSDLDRPWTGPMAQLAPTVGALLHLISDHSLMHAGQFTVVRRKLGKPVLF